MTPKSLVTQRIKTEWQEKKQLWKLVYDWTVMLYMVVPGLVIGGFFILRQLVRTSTVDARNSSSDISVLYFLRNPSWTVALLLPGSRSIVFASTNRLDAFNKALRLKHFIISRQFKNCDCILSRITLFLMEFISLISLNFCSYMYLRYC